jgi:hypothetical protein
LETSDSQTVLEKASKAAHAKGSPHIQEESEAPTTSLAGVPSRAGLAQGGLNIKED